MNVTTRIGAPPVDQIFTSQLATALALRSSTAAERIAKLKKLEAAVLANRQGIYDALWADLHKPEAEADLAEIMHVVGEARHAAKHLRGWMRPRGVAPTLAMLGTQARIRQEPKGRVLIIAPWNYPIGLTLGPVVSAVAAGNAIIIKPSELSPNCSAIMGKIIAEVFSPGEVALVEGDASVATALLELPFDHIFFTGSPAIGKIVMAAAAKNLTSVTLELGGKSPVIVDNTADIKKAAASVAWGKFINAGQTCIAPDYMFVHETILPQFIPALREAIAKMFGPDAKASADYCRIISPRHFTRVEGLLADATAKGATALADGAAAGEQKYIPPTLLTNVPMSAEIMSQEIFGPVLPVIGYKDLGTVIAHINAHPKPLALYIYGKDQHNIDRIITETSSGGVAINMSVLQFTHSNLPFGGVNNSGIGSSHGVYGFRAFSHERAILRDRMSVTPMLFPPYTARVKNLIKMTLRYFA